MLITASSCAGLSTGSRLMIVKSHLYHLAQNKSSIDALITCGTIWSYYVFMCIKQQANPLEFRLDAEHMSQDDILLWDNHCIFLPNTPSSCKVASNHMIILILLSTEHICVCVSTRRQQWVRAFWQRNWLCCSCVVSFSQMIIFFVKINGSLRVICEICPESSTSQLL